MLKGMKNIHFVIAGPPSNQDIVIRREIKGQSNISYVGTVSDEEKIMLIKASYLNILLSRMEALGLTQLEFMYGGNPIITSAVGGQGWLVRNGVEGIHVKGPNDIVGAAEAIKKLVNNPELHDEIGANARTRAEEFTLSKITTDLISHLKSLLAS